MRYRLLKQETGPTGEITTDHRTADASLPDVSDGASAGGVESELKRLTVDQRAAVHLKSYQGFKFDEMAVIRVARYDYQVGVCIHALDLLKKNSGSNTTSRRSGRECEHEECVKGIACLWT